MSLEYLLRTLIKYYCNTRSLGAPRAPTSSWRSFGPPDFVLRALWALRPYEPRVGDCIGCKPSFFVTQRQLRILGVRIHHDNHQHHNHNCVFGILSADKHEALIGLVTLSSSSQLSKNYIWFLQDRYFNTDLRQGMEHLEMGVYERSTQNLYKLIFGHMIFGNTKIINCSEKIVFLVGKMCIIHVWSNEWVTATQ